MGPREKLRRVASGATSSEQISQFSQAGAQLNLPRNCDASLKSAAAGFRCWGCFCGVATRPHSPPTGQGVRARSSLFRAGRSFKIYVARLEKPRPSLGIDTSWKATAVAAAGYGLAKAGDRSSAHRPAIPKAQLCGRVTSLSLQGELALIAMVGCSFCYAFPPNAYS